MSAFLLLLFVLFSVLLLFQSNPDDSGHLALGIKKQVLTVDDTDLIVLVLIVIFSLLCATRVESSYDTEVYRQWYMNLINMPFWRIDGQYELVFEMLSKIFGLFFGTHFRLFLFALALLNNLIVYKVLRKVEGVGSIGYILYLFFAGFYYNYAVLRQGLAITFLIWAFASWKDKKKLFSLLILASMTHRTAILALILAIVVHFVQFGKTPLLIIWGMALVNYIYPLTDNVLEMVIPFIGRFIPASMMGRYELYFLNTTGEHTISLYYILYFLIILMLILCVYDKDRTKGDSTIIVNEAIGNRRMLNIGVAGLLLLSIGASFTVVIRLADYMILPCIIFLAPMCLKNFGVTVKKAAVLVLCSIALVLYLRIFLSQAPVYI